MLVNLVLQFHISMLGRLNRDCKNSRQNLRRQKKRENCTDWLCSSVLTTLQALKASNQLSKLSRFQIQSTPSVNLLHHVNIAQSSQSNPSVCHHSTSNNSENRWPKLTRLTHMCVTCGRPKTQLSLHHVLNICRRLCVAGYSGQVILFKFKKQECVSDTLVLEIPITYENTDETDVSPECEFIPRSLPKQPDSVENEKKVSLERFRATWIIYSFAFCHTHHKPFSLPRFSSFGWRGSAMACWEFVQVHKENRLDFKLN